MFEYMSDEERQLMRQLHVVDESELNKIMEQLKEEDRRKEKAQRKRRVINFICYVLLFIIGTFACAYCIALYNYPERAIPRHIDRIYKAAVRVGYEADRTDDEVVIKIDNFDDAVKFTEEKFGPKMLEQLYILLDPDDVKEFVEAVITIDRETFEYAIYFDVGTIISKANGTFMPPSETQVTLNKQTESPQD